MPIVQIHMFEGRTAEQKRALVRKVTDAVAETISVPPDVVHIVISEMGRGDYAEGGVLYSEKQ